MHGKIKMLFYIIPIVILILLAIFFKFCLTGYSFLSIVLLFIAAIIGAYLVLSFKDTALFKNLRITLTCFVAVFLILFTISEVHVITNMNKRERADSKYCIVLGAGVHGTTPSRVLNQRIHAAYDFLTKYPDTIAILSGGQGKGEDITEASAIKDHLVKMGIDEKRLILEERSTNTKENLKYSKEILEKIAPNTTEVTIITSDTHLYRACYLAKKEGFTPKGYYAYTDYHVLRLTYTLREGVAVWKDWLI